MGTSRLSELANFINEELRHVGVFVDAHLRDHVDEVENRPHVDV